VKLKSNPPPAHSGKTGMRGKVGGLNCLKQISPSCPIWFALKKISRKSAAGIVVWAALRVVVRMGSRYRKGHRWELKVKKMWEAKGFVVYRSAGSKGAADLIALKNGKIVLIQVKINNKPTREEVAKLLKEAKKCKATALVVLWNSKKREVEVYNLNLTKRKVGNNGSKSVCVEETSKVC